MSVHILMIFFKDQRKFQLYDRKKIVKLLADLSQS